MAPGRGLDPQPVTEESQAFPVAPGGCAAGGEGAGEEWGEECGSNLPPESPLGVEDADPRWSFQDFPAPLPLSFERGLKIYIFITPRVTPSRKLVTGLILRA